MKDSDGVRWHRIDVAGTALEVRTSRDRPHGGRRLWPSIGEYPVYDDFFYQVMLQDEERNKLFRAAVIDHAAGRVALELGAGPDLLWTSLAAESGAIRVFAVEALEESARIAQERAREIGSHVSVMHGDATQVVLPEKADMCIAELVGAIAGAEGIAAVLEDARQRHLHSDAVIVPYRVTTPIAALGARELLGGAPAFHPEAASYVARIFNSVESIFDLRVSVSGLTEEDLLTDTGTLEDLNLGIGLHQNPAEIRLEVTRAGEIDSLVLWLRLQCAPGQPFLDSITTETNWTPVLVPFDADLPVAVVPGDLLVLDVTRRLHDGVHPEWSFAGLVRHLDGSTATVRARSPYAHGPVRGSWLHRALFREPGPADRVAVTQVRGPAGMPSENPSEGG